MASQDQILREFLETYNRIVEECFNRCIYTFNYRYLLDDEIDCSSRCASKFMNVNQRIAMNFAEIQSKKMIDMQEQAEARSEEQASPTSNSQMAGNSKQS